MLVGNGSDIQSGADLAKPGRKIVIRPATTADELVSKNYPSAVVQKLGSESACLLEIVNGRSEAFIYDQLSIWRLHQAQPEATRAILQPLQLESWAMELRQNEPELKKQINTFLKEFRAAGGFERLTKTYLAAEQAAMQSQGVPFIFE
jgi:polar amino acid transport system substrate-binding protein